jgi:transaldolase
MPNLNDLTIEIFADGADLTGMLEMAAQPYISGLTTNPTLMKKAGVKNYAEFAQDVLREIPDKPISFEVFSDDFPEMIKQAEQIASWGENVFIKVPISNTKGTSTVPVISHLTSMGIKVNVTALMTVAQVISVVEVLNPSVESNISVFAGRIADTGLDPIPVMKTSLQEMKVVPSSKLIWASPRELLNVIQADAIGCHIITATSDILKKLSLIGYNLTDYSLDTVKMFYNDALSAGYTIET